MLLPLAHNGTLFYLFINNDLLIYIKKEKKRKKESIQECTNQIHKSSKSKIEDKDWFLHIDNKPNMVLKKQ